MAAREGQGLQIAVILFAMLTIILAITTYVFYAQSQTAAKERDDATRRAGDLQTANNKMLYRIMAYKYALGLDGVGMEQLQAARNAAGGVDDPEATALMNAYTTDMAMFGAQVAETGAQNYRTLPPFLIASLNKKNQSVVTANEQTAQAQAAKDATEKAEKARADKAEEAAATAVADLAKERESFVSDRKTMDDMKNKLAAQLAERDKKSRSEIEAVAKERDTLQAQGLQMQTVITLKTERLEELEKGQVDLFENPDGKITWVNQRQRLVWINAGRADGLMRQTTFSVYDHDENGVSNAKPKGRIEVIRLSDDHMAECRILEDSASNPILPGDVIHTPSWSPGQRIHFAMAGVMDIDGDSVDDYPLVRNIITLNGGVIDAELLSDGTPKGKISPDTRYLVMGTQPTDRSTPKMLSEFTKLREEATRFGTDIITVQKLLAQMGWKAEERSVELAGSRGGEFRTRKPGQKAPAAGGAGQAAGEAAPAAEPAAPAAGGGVDPFAAPAADPFAVPGGAAPMPMPMPATPPAEADPFAP